MEQETLFTSSKWDILKCLEQGSKSPIDLAKETNTSVANISQQLRLLELAGFVKSERISNRDKGLPRILYSLTDNYSYLIVSTTGFVDKKFFRLQEYQKTILKIWFMDNTSLHRYVEKFFWSLEKYLDKIDIIALESNGNENVNVLLLSSNSDLKKSIKDSIIEGPFGNKKFTISFIKDSELKKSLDGKYILYDPKHLVK